MSSRRSPKLYWIKSINKTLSIRSKTLISNQGLTFLRFLIFFIYIFPRTSNSHIRSKTLIPNQGLTFVHFLIFYIYISPRTSKSHLSYTFVSKLVHIHCPLVLLYDCKR